MFEAWCQGGCCALGRSHVGFLLMWCVFCFVLFFPPPYDITVNLMEEFRETGRAVTKERGSLPRSNELSGSVRQAGA